MRENNIPIYQKVGKFDYIKIYSLVQINWGKYLPYKIKGIIL